MNKDWNFEILKKRRKITLVIENLGWSCLEKEIFMVSLGIKEKII